jgi:pimeloyl-ACP methyl ester carboxylesterase
MQCDLDSATIHYEEYGQGQGQGRPIVFLHGWSMDHRLESTAYEPIFTARGGWRRIYLDLPGMGRSLAKRIRNQDDVLAALLAFIDRVLRGERFVLSGTSLGGYLARAIAARRREQVAGLLLRVPAVIADTAKRTLPPFRPLVRNEALLAPLDAEERAALGDVLVQSPAYLEAHQHQVRELVQPAVATNTPLVAEIRGDPRRYGLSFDLAEAEKIFTRPTLIIAARQDTVTGYRDVRDILESYPRATFAVMDRATHGWPIESPRLLAALVEDWLDRIELSEKGA